MDLRILIDQAHEYVCQYWMNYFAYQYPIVRVDVSPGILKDCKALQLYTKGYEHVGFESNTIFGWHGTSWEAIPKICDEGFDPSLRKYTLISIQINMSC